MNTIPIGALFGLLTFLILLSGFFSGSETALMTLNRYRLRHLANSGHKGAMRAAKLLENPEKLIGLILLGNNFVNILASAIATVIALRLLGESGIAVATGSLTLVILVFAEVTPKTLATKRAEPIAFFAASIYTPLLKIFYPLVYIVNVLTSQILKLFNVSMQSDETHDDLSRDELRTLVTEAGNLIPERHQKMLVNILDLESVTVNDIMIPRNEIVGIDLEDDWQEVLQQIETAKQSRLPVFRENLDNIVGFIYLRKMLNVLRQREIQPAHLEAHIRNTYFIPENTPLTVQLLNFQKQKRRIGMVVDEYGDIQGLVTLGDILEEIVGEFTTNPANLVQEIQQQSDDSYISPGSTTIRQLNQTLNWNLSLNGPKTLNGIILEKLEEIPKAGDTIDHGHYTFEILSMDRNMVDKVKITTNRPIRANEATIIPNDENDSHS